MPDTLNKQTLVNLLIDSPLREPIKINLIDIVNNTSDADLPKVFPTIVKELEIFQKATERRMKLADETIAKLGGTAAAPTDTVTPDTIQAAAPAPTPSAPPAPAQPLPPLDLPPLPPAPAPIPTAPTPATPPLSVPPLDLPPLPSAPTNSSEAQTTPPASCTVTPTPTPTAPTTSSSDEAALAEIQKELDSLKSGVAADAAAPIAPTAPAQ